FIMDDPNITMEEYIRLGEEKARRHGRTFNWQTATYGKMEYCEDEDDSFTNLKTEYPAIVFEDTSDAALLCEPTVSPLDNNEIDFKISFDESDDEDYMPSRNMEPLPSREQRHPWLRYQVEGYGEDIVHSYDMSDTEMGLDVADTLCFQLGGARRRMTWRQFILALGLHTEEEMAEAGMIACSISGRGQAHEKVTGVDLFYLCSMDQGTANVSYILAQYLFRHAEGRKNGARLSV
ncbi:hypothetical protein Tco_1036915, partial [Tanacetum coccineum]